MKIREKSVLPEADPTKWGENVSCDFGGGGGTCYRARPPNQLWRPQKVGLVWSVPVPVSARENDRAFNKRGGRDV